MTVTARHSTAGIPHLFCPVEVGSNPGGDRDTPNVLSTPFMRERGRERERDAVGGGLERRRGRAREEASCCDSVLDNVIREAEWHSGYHRWLSSHRSPVRTRPVAVHPPTGLARPGTGAPPAFTTFIMPRCTLDGQLQHTGARPQRNRAKTGPATCSTAPHHRPRSTGGCHPTRCLPLPEPPLRRLGQRGSNLGPAALASRVLPLRHMALQPT